MLRHHRPESRQYRVIGTLKSVKKLKRLNRPKVYKKSKCLHQLLRDVNTVEGEGDRLYRNIIKQLFSKPETTVDIIKWKDIYDDMENVLDSCEDVANIIEGVLMKNG